MPPVSTTAAVPTDEIYDRYLKKAITEINELGDEIRRAAGRKRAVPVHGTGHPLGDIMLLKYSPRPSEVQEGVAFFGRSGQAILKSLQRLHVDPMAAYGTNCLKFEGATERQAKPWLVREIHIVQPKLIIVMGEDTLRFLNALRFPLSEPVTAELGSLQHLTPTIEALVVPDIDASLDEQAAKSRFWAAFKGVGPWWSELPPY